MSISFIELHKSDHALHYGSYQNKDTFLICLNTLLNDLIGWYTEEEMAQWLNSERIIECEANLSRIVKLSKQALGFGVTLDDDSELFLISRQQFLDIMAQWREIRKRAPYKIILARDENRIWLSEYEEFKRNYQTSIDTDITFDNDYLFEGYALPNHMLAGMFKLDKKTVDNSPNKFSIIKNHNNKYGIVQIKTEYGTIERTMFLWEYNDQDMLHEFALLIKKYYQQFDPHRIYRQSEVLVSNSDGYIISMILDHDTNKIIAASPLRSNFY